MATATEINDRGETYDRKRDGERLSRQASSVFTVMKDGEWRTLEQILMLTGEPEASISARLRDLRKPKYGGYIVERRYQGNGLWEYRVDTGERD